MSESRHAFLVPLSRESSAGSRLCLATRKSSRIARIARDHLRIFGASPRNDLRHRRSKWRVHLQGAEKLVSLDIFSLGFFPKVHFFSKKFQELLFFSLSLSSRLYLSFPVFLNLWIILRFIRTVFRHSYNSMIFSFLLVILDSRRSLVVVFQWVTL